MTHFTFNLDKKAKSAGGDKYTSSSIDWLDGSIYVPQTLSRTTNEEVYPTLLLETHSQSGYNFTLKQKAKKVGADRYYNEELSFDMYIPQTISRKNGVALDSIRVSIGI